MSNNEKTHVAFFGDSYCADTLVKYTGLYQTDFKPYFWPQKTYIDYFIEVSGLELSVGETGPITGMSGHGPNFMIDQFRLWLHNTENKDNIQNTHFVFCWSDPCRDLFPVPDNPGQEMPAIPTEAGTLDKFPEQYRHAVDLWWLYIRNEKNYFRYYETTKLAWKQLIAEFGITSYQNYHCFRDVATYDNNCYQFEFGGNTYSNLFDFAHSFSDYDIEVDRTYPNHFSPNGSIAMSELLMHNFKKETQ